MRRRCVWASWVVGPWVHRCLCWRRWSALGRELQRRLQSSRLLLQAWEGHCGRAAALTCRLQTLRAVATATASGAPAEGDVEQVADRIRQVEVRRSGSCLCQETSAASNIRWFPPQDLLQTADVLQSDLQGALEASRTLTDLLEPSAASLVQSELRLLSRDLQEISWNLNLKLGQLQVRTVEWAFDEVYTPLSQIFKD